MNCKLLSFGQTFQASTFDRADVHENVLAPAFLLDKAKALLAVEELDDSFAGTDHLRGHPGETAAAGTATQAAWATRAAATGSAARRTAAAKAITAAAETIAAAAEFTRRRKTVIPAAERIETIFAETVALVAAAPASPIVTHKSERTLPHCPSSSVPVAWTVSRTGHRRSELNELERTFRPTHSAQRVALRTILQGCIGNRKRLGNLAGRECLCVPSLLGMKPR